MRLPFCISLCLLLPLLVKAQSSCPPLQAPVFDSTKLLFSPQQEQELGEIIRQQLESRFRVIGEEQVTAYPQAHRRARKPAPSRDWLAL